MDHKRQQITLKKDGKCFAFVLDKQFRGPVCRIQWHLVVSLQIATD